MNTQPIRNFLSLGSLRSLLLSAALATSLTSISGCGGSADQTIATSNSNTPLTIGNFSGLKGYTVGSAQVYSVTVKDPDGVASVTVTLDGVNIPITNVGDVYSITAPASLAAGTHSVIFSARGKSADGTLEVPISEGINFTVYIANTPLAVGAIQGFAAYTLGTAQTYFTDINDPDGIRSVTATLNGRSIPVTNAGSRYSAVIPANTPAGNNIVRFEGIGKQPNAADEAATSAQLAFIVYPNNTGLVAGSITGITSYTVGGTQTYSLSPVDSDGITSVTATLDGGPVALTVSNNTYSFNTPSNLAVGNHAISFTATGKQPNGSAEVPITVSQSFTVLTTNTNLNIGAIAGATTYTVGNVQQYTTIVTDPDGVVSVTATLNGNALTAAPSGSSYSITLGTNLAAGNYTLQFSAIGRRPDGSSEAAQTVTQSIQILPVNTALSISAISGLASYVVGASPTYSTNVVDPDGIRSVSATLDGQNIGINNVGAAYSVVIPSSTARGPHTLAITAQGTTPGGGQETAQTQSFAFTVLAQNTALSLSAVSGPTTITLGAIGTYSVTVTDPDGIASVTAEIDNVAANVIVNGSVYSVQSPAYTAGGAHSVTFTAVGQTPGGGRENAQLVSLGFTAQTSNTPITISAINGVTSFTFGQAPQFSFDVIDPDGIVSVDAVLNGQQSLRLATPATGSTYSVRIPANLAVGTYDLVVTAVGTIPGGLQETAQTQPFRFTVLPVNTLLTISVVTVVPGNLSDIWSVTVIEPDGPFTVTATANGFPQTVTRNGNVFSITTSSTQTGAITFTATGIQPDGQTEQPISQTYSAIPN